MIIIVSMVEYFLAGLQPTSPIGKSLSTIAFVVERHAENQYLSRHQCCRYSTGVLSCKYLVGRFIHCIS